MPKLSSKLDLTLSFKELVSFITFLVSFGFVVQQGCQVKHDLNELEDQVETIHSSLAETREELSKLVGAVNAKK